MTQSLAKVNDETAGVVTPLAEGDSSIDIDSVEMVVSIERTEGRVYSKSRILGAIIIILLSWTKK